MLGLFLVGLTAYLKSALSNGSEEASDDVKKPAEVQPEELPLALNDSFVDVHDERPEATPFELADSPAFDYSDVKGSATPISLGEVLAFRPPADKGSLSQPSISTASAAVLQFPISKVPNSAANAASGSDSRNPGSNAPGGDEDSVKDDPDSEDAVKRQEQNAAIHGTCIFARRLRMCRDFDRCQRSAPQYHRP